jgi:hypothetical protein
MNNNADNSAGGGRVSSNSELAQLAELLLQFTLYVNAMIAENRKDMQRVSELTHEAVEQLGASFMELEDKARQMSRLAGLPPTQATEAERELLQVAIKSEGARAVRNLQYQDIISQILGAADRNLAQVERTSRRLRDSLPDEALDKELLASVHKELKQLIADISSGAVHPVAQSSMQAGSVDLF